MSTEIPPSAKKGTKRKRKVAPTFDTVDAQQQAIAKESTRLQKAQLAESTQKSYSSRSNQFAQWLANWNANYVRNPLNKVDLRGALDKLSDITATAAELYLAQRNMMVVHATLQGDHAALKRFFEDTFGNPAQQPGWTLRTDDAWVGNPVNSRDICNLMSAAKKEDAKVSTTRQAWPMLPRDLDVILRYLDRRALSPDSRHEKAVTLYMAAYLTLGWHLWARTDETSNLRVKDHLPKRWIAGRQEWAPSISITFRKTNQNDRSKIKYYTCREYLDPALKNLKPIPRLLVWRDYVQASTGIPSAPEHFLFLSISASGNIDVEQQMAKATFDRLMRRIVEDSGLAGLMPQANFTAHCLRRGAALWYANFANPKWSPQELKSWGGWSEGDGADVLIKYILEDRILADDDMII